MFAVGMPASGAINIGYLHLWTTFVTHNLQLHFFQDEKMNRAIA